MAGEQMEEDELVAKKSKKENGPRHLVLVVAVYNEDCAWLAKVPQQFQQIWVFYKGASATLTFADPRIKVVRVPNRGREGETYLRWITDNYDHFLEDSAFVFCQGNPFDHSPDFLKLLKGLAQAEDLGEYYGLTLQYNERLPPKIFEADKKQWKWGRVKQYWLDKNTCYIQGPSHLKDRGMLNVMRGVRRRFGVRAKISVFDWACDEAGVARPQRYVPFDFSGCFFVSAECIRQHPVSVYQKLKELLDVEEQGGAFGYLLEHMWAFLFTGKSEAFCPTPCIHPFHETRVLGRVLTKEERQ